MSEHPLNDAMPPRALTARWVIRGTLTLETALHLGGEGTERVDMPVLRDPRNGKPLLPGTTFTGALRSALADRLLGYGRAERAGDETSAQDQAIAALLGGARGDDDGSQSPLIVFDAYGELPADEGIEIRDGVSISPKTGTAEDHKKYDYEVLPSGTTFAVRVDLLLPAPALKDGAAPPEEKSLLEKLAGALDAFAHGEGAFGAKRSRGLGRVSAVWAARRFGLDTEAGWIDWILSDHKRPFFAANHDQSCIRDALEAAAPEALRPLSLSGDARKRVVIDLDLKVAHDILVRSPGADPSAPDVSHLHSGGTAILPGTSLAGVMRAQALRIAKLFHDETKATNLVDDLFGPRFEGQRPSEKLKPRASRLRIGEARFEGSQPQRQTRAAIDRFTQGVVDTALFDEQTEVGGRATVRLELRNGKAGELGLALLVLKDLLDGSLPVGGTSGVGRGVLRGSATVTWHDGDGTAPRSATIQAGKPPAGEAAGEIDGAIRVFHQAGSPAPASDDAGAGLNAEGSS